MKHYSLLLISRIASLPFIIIITPILLIFHPQAGSGQGEGGRDGSQRTGHSLQRSL